MDYFAGALLATQYDKVSYHENHDEAGNESNTERTIVTAVNSAPLIGTTRKYAEARSRFALRSGSAVGGNAHVFDGRRDRRGEILSDTTIFF